MKSRPGLTGPILEYVILAGSLLPRTKSLGRVAALPCILSAPLNLVVKQALATMRSILSAPRTRGPLSLVLGVAGCNSRAGLVRFMLAQADYELGHGRNEVVRLAL